MTLSQQYPGDVGMSADPDVVWTENFELGALSTIAARYDEVVNLPGMLLTSDKPAASRGRFSLQMTSSGSVNATHFYKNLAGSTGGQSEWFVRYYVKYPPNMPWHHTGMWIGGYNPPLNWPYPHAGQKPNGDDRFAIAFEPYAISGDYVSGSNVQMDFFNYWMNMHSWMATPSGSTAYYGNSIVHDPSVVAPDNQWTCIELHVKLNSDTQSGGGAVLGVWQDDRLIQQFTETGPLGYWIRDKFCPVSSTDPTCTAYHTQTDPIVPLDLQFRNTTALQLNYLWMQNYITEAASGTVAFDDVVVAKRRVGCIRN